MIRLAEVHQQNVRRERAREQVQPIPPATTLLSSSWRAVCLLPPSEALGTLTKPMERRRSDLEGGRQQRKRPRAGTARVVNASLAAAGIHHRAFGRVSPPPPSHYQQHLDAQRHDPLRTHHGVYGTRVQITAATVQAVDDPFRRGTAGDQWGPYSLRDPFLSEADERKQNDTLETWVSSRAGADPTATPTPTPDHPRPHASTTPANTESGSRDHWRPVVNASRNITFDMLRAHFQKPLKDAANHFGVCTTLLKKICRRNGIQSWPYRQIIGLQKSIVSMEQQVQYFDGEQRRQYAEQLRKLERKLESFIHTGDAPPDEEDEHGDNTPAINQAPPTPAVQSPQPRVSHDEPMPPSCHGNAVHVGRTPHVAYRQSAFQCQDAPVQLHPRPRSRPAGHGMPQDQGDPILRRMPSFSLSMAGVAPVHPTSSSFIAGPARLPPPPRPLPSLAFMLNRETHHSQTSNSRSPHETGR